MPRPIVVSIDGNIGCGKSTFLQYLRDMSVGPDGTATTVGCEDDTDMIMGNFGELKVAFVPEPIREWDTVRDSDGNPMLKIFYEDQCRNAFSFQMMAYITRLVALRRALESDVDVVIVERCLYTDREVFAKMLREDGAIREVDYDIYTRWFEEFAVEVRPDHVFYLCADPTVCLQRTRARARNGEDSISLEYLTRCHEYHETWLRENRMLLCVHIINANQGTDKHESWCQLLMDILNEESRRRDL